MGELAGAAERELGTRLVDAILDNDLDALHRLALQGADLTRGNETMSPLQAAIDHGTLDAVRYLLHQGVDPKTLFHDGLTPLHHAVMRGRHKVVGLLLSEGADPHQTCTRTGASAIAMAMQAGYLNLANQLQTARGSPRAERFMENLWRWALVFYAVMVLATLVPTIRNGRRAAHRHLTFTLVLMVITWVLAAVLFLATWASDPGVVAKNSTSSDARGAPVRGVRCPACKCSRPPRAKHCHRCNRCVLRMSHHCEWAGHCIGERNHGVYVMFLVSQTLALLFAGIYNAVLATLSSIFAAVLCLALAAYIATVLGTNLEAISQGLTINERECQQQNMPGYEYTRQLVSASAAAGSDLSSRLRNGWSFLFGAASRRGGPVLPFTGGSATAGSSGPAAPTSTAAFSTKAQGSPL